MKGKRGLTNKIKENEGVSYLLMHARPGQSRHCSHSRPVQAAHPHGETAHP